ncbi:histidine kinase [uncultured Tenacibaculum sp.]|uniref:sensor histidine kinase n=1 Tax=uncultured Tenacibaculum sp. TaxID=174713 RepID=UPI00262E212E|nr:histidine kinase [uncultured Tenacibaculum sp.]
MNKITLYLYFILLFSSTVMLSQHPVFEHLTEKDGLPDIEFYGALEDNEGFIWLAADKGLFRYDGKDFKNYTHPEKRGLSVFGLKLDSKGRIWCNNISGQYFFIENDQLNLFTDIEEYARGQLASFLFYKNSLIASNLGYIAKIDVETKEKKIFRDSIDVVTSVFKSNDSLFFLSKDYFKHSITGNKFINKLPLGNNISIEGETNYFTHKNKEFVYSFNYQADGVNVERPSILMKHGNAFKKIVLPNILRGNTIIKSFYDAGNEFWFGTNKGVIICEYKKGEFLYKKTNFKGKYITSFLKDRYNNYWYTTLRNGVFIVPNSYLNKYELEEYRQNISAMDKVGENTILFGATNGNIGVIDIKQRKFKNFDLEDKEKVFAIIGLSDELALISFGTYCYIFNIKTEVCRKIFINGNVKDFSLIDKDKVVMAAYSSAAIVSVNTQEEIKRIGFKRSYSTYYSKKSKKIYVGYVYGVNEYDSKFKSKPITYKNRPIFAVDIDETNNGVVWFSTFKDGIIGLKEDGTMINYRKKNGLLSNLTSVIKSDGDFLWVSTNKGVQVLNTITGKFRNLTKRHGLNSFNISDISIFDETVFLSSNKGVFQVDKEKVFTNSILLDFYFTKILVEDKSVSIEKSYKLESNTKKIEFNFHTNGFLAEDNIEYKYRLLGASKEWNSVSKGINQVTFNNLAAGTYAFQIKAVQINGKEETAIKTIELNIKPPFYKEWWFVLSVITSLFVVIWFRFNARLKTLKRNQEETLDKERMQKQLVSSKLESLQSQMNPHFTFNALNSIQNLVLKGDKYEAYDYLTKFSLLIRENLNMSKKSFVQFDEELQLLKKYLELEKLRFREEFSYEIIGSEDVGDIKIPTMIIQPYIENALKHGLLHKEGNDKKVVIEFKQEDVLKCIITDNGIGIEASKKIKIQNKVTRESFSTKAIEDKLIFLKEYYKVDIGVCFEKVEEGTRVVIKLPYTIAL